jgi:uncharacterized protein involved in type VI secretion and phage assembly
MTNASQAITGVVIGIVKEIDAQRACIKVDFPWMQPPQRSHWAPIATLMSGRNRGVYYLPEIDDEVLIAFDQGKFDDPFVVGFLWNGVDVPPANDQHLRLIRSVNGHEIAIYDPPVSQGDKGYVHIKDAQGNSVELANGRITITGKGTIQILAPNVTINGRLVSPVGPPI